MTTHELSVSAAPDMPAIVIERTFTATPQQLLRAHTDRDLIVRWLGPADLAMELDVWDCRPGGEFRYVHRLDTPDGVEEHWFRGCFHDVGPSRLVQTFTYEGMPDAVALETLTFEELGGGVTRLRAVSLCDSFEARDQWLASDMESGLVQGYAKLDELCDQGAA